MEKPNLNLPLAISYNQRGVQGDTNATTGIDQRKINCMYELVRNSITGNSTLYLTKRPGVTKDLNIFGVSTQQPYLIKRDSAQALTVDSQGIGVFYVDGGNVKVATQGVTNTVLATTALLPVFASDTLISAVPTNMIQLDTTGFSGAQRVFYSSNFFVTWTEITNAVFLAILKFGKMEHMDGYAFILDATNQIWNSNLNSISGWTAATFITKQIVQDYPVGLARLGNQILAFGEQTVEAFYNASNPSGSPLTTIKQLQHRVGLVAPSPTGARGTTPYYAIVNDILYFVGRRTGGKASKSVFAYDGAHYLRISTDFIDSILAEATVYSVVQMGFEGKMGVAFVLTDVNTSPQRWLMFFPDWKDWFEWTSTVFIPSAESAYGMGLKANSLGHRIYNIPAVDNWQDDGTSYQFATQFKLPSNGNDRKVMASFGVKGDTARSANSLLVEASDDDFVSFRTIGTIDMTKPIKAGTRGGSYIDRCIRLSNTNSVETRLQSFVATIK